MKLYIKSFIQNHLAYIFFNLTMLKFKDTKFWNKFQVRIEYKHCMQLLNWIQKKFIRNPMFFWHYDVTTACVTDSDCPIDSICVDMLHLATKFLLRNGAFDQYDVIVRKAGIKGKECWVDPQEALSRIDMSDIVRENTASKNRYQ